MDHGWENMLSHSITAATRNAKKECVPIAQLPAPPVSPTPCEGEKKNCGDFILKKQEVRPLVHLGRLLDGGSKLEGYKSLGMFNIKKAIRM